MNETFITFEGGEACGKSTQIAMLAERLRKMGHQVTTVREPGGTLVGEQIRHLLQYAHESADMTPETELLLFAASRAQLVREVIQPALQAGHILIADRFLDSTLAYQGAARQLDLDAVSLINTFAIDGCIPNATVLLDLDVETARQRLLRRTRPVDAKDRIEDLPIEFHERVRQGYLQLAAKNPNRFCVIDATGDPNAIFSALWEKLSAKFNGFPTY